MQKKKIFLALSEHKNFLTPFELAQPLCSVLSGNFDVKWGPVSDGGAQFLSSLDFYRPFHKFNSYETLNFKGDSISVNCGLFEEEIWIQSADILGSGKQLSYAAKHRWEATSFGLGLLLKSIIEDGHRRVNIVLGGSVVTDFGVGLFSGLGGTLLSNAKIAVPNNGQYFEFCELATLENMTAILPELPKIELNILSDTRVRVTGKFGQARVFGPQKYFSTEETSWIDQNAGYWVHLLSHLSSRDLGGLGLGGSGGTAAALFALFPNSKISSGFDEFAKLTRLFDFIENSDLLLFSEGCFDNTSLTGKVGGELLTYCERHSIPALVLAGQSTISDPAVSVLALDKYRSEPLTKQSFFKSIQTASDDILKLMNGSNNVAK